jgi:hypothetical protein
MSFWMKLGLTITDLTVFKTQCQRHNVTYQENKDPNFMMNGSPVEAVLLDGRGQGRSAYLVRDKGAFRLVWDNDRNYSPLAKRLGANGGKLTRDYTVDMVKKNAANSGGMILNTTENADGSVLLRVAVGGM